MGRPFHVCELSEINWFGGDKARQFAPLRRLSPPVACGALGRGPRMGAAEGNGNLSRNRAAPGRGSSLAGPGRSPRSDHENVYEADGQ